MFPNNWKTAMFIHVIFLVFDFNRKKNNQPKRKLVYFAIKGNECLAAYIPLHSEFKLQMIKHTQKSRCAQTSRAAQTRSVYLECGRQSHYHNFIWNRTFPSGLSALQSFGMAIWCGVPTFDTHSTKAGESVLTYKHSNQLAGPAGTALEMQEKLCKILIQTRIISQ